MRYTVKGNVWGFLVWDTVLDKAASEYTYLRDAAERAKALNEG